MDALKYVSQILDDADSWETMMFLYDAALRQMSTKIDILNEEFIHIHNYNPIEHVKSRIKEPKSIVKKLKRHGHEVTLENMLKYITDIAGIRIIVPLPRIFTGSLICWQSSRICALWNLPTTSLTRKSADTVAIICWWPSRYICQTVWWISS